MEGEPHQRSIGSALSYASIGFDARKTFGDVVIEVFEETFSSVGHLGLNLLIEFQAKLRECGVYLFLATVLLIDAIYLPLDIITRCNRAKDFIAGTEDPFEQVEFLVKKLVYALIRLISFVKEINDNNIMLLSVSMAATDSLFDALRVPGKVVIDDQRAELEVQSLRCGLCCNHDLTFLTEVVNKC